MVGGLFLSWGRPTREQQKACIASSRGFNYDDKFHGASSSSAPGSQRGNELVPVDEEALSKNGFSINRARVLLGSGPRTFDIAKSALLSWKHFGLGWAFVDPKTPVEKGERFCVCVKEVLPWLMMPLQVAYVRDDIAGGSGSTKASFAFGSGTLQGHLLKGNPALPVNASALNLDGKLNSRFFCNEKYAGEERFSVELDENDKVWYEIYSFSKPAHFLSVISYPYVKLRQKIFAQQSADEVKRHIATK